MGEPKEACACLKIEWRTAELDDGGKVGHWRCVECSREYTSADEVGRAIRELVERVDRLEQRDRPTKLPDLLRQLRANGVRRYKRAGDEIEIEIELSRGPGAAVDAPGLAQWLPEPGPAPKPRRCGACHEPEPGHKDGCWVAEAKAKRNDPTGPPPDEQPPVEIDMAALDELLKRQDAKRQGTGQ